MQASQVDTITVESCELTVVTQPHEPPFETCTSPDSLLADSSKASQRIRVPRRDYHTHPRPSDFDKSKGVGKSVALSAGGKQNHISHGDFDNREVCNSVASDAKSKRNIISPPGNSNDYKRNKPSTLDAASTRELLAPRKKKSKGRYLFTTAELFAGIGAFMLSFALQGILPVAFLERDTLAHEITSQCFPKAINSGDFYDREWTNWPKADIMALGFECQPYSGAGMQQGIDDERSSQLAESAETARFLGVKFVIAENVSLFLEHHEVIKAADRAYCRAGYQRVLTEVVEHTRLGGASIRSRVFLVYRLISLDTLLPKLVINWPHNVAPGQMKMHLLPDYLVPKAAYLTGSIKLKQIPASADPRAPQIAAQIMWLDNSLQRGSLVILKHYPGKWRVMESWKGRGKILIMPSLKHPQMHNTRHE